MKQLNDILETYRRGDRLTDDEMDALNKAMKALADAASPFGDLFLTTYIYAKQVRMSTDDYLAHRRSKKRL